ncbi:MAG: DUF294 nucleotidyltransferase-like domain-containing protein, partial [Lentisphaerae bacterium]|nr:DUF294 nucleotidyltransferase-like domain-containing protein [Lentisphaerota bacterium]
MPENEDGGFVVLVRRAEELDAKTTPAADSLLKRLLNLPSTAAEDVAQEIARADTLDQVAERCRRTPELVRSTIESGASPTAVAGMIASITDSATIKSIELVQADIGPAPVPFAFVTVGSQGRMEQTLFTDQDNIIIYDPPGNRPNPEHEEYFARLAGRVCENLAAAGYRHCEGQLMASNPKWRRPLEAWRGIFSHWIRKAEGQEAMDFVTFFDLRCVWGQEELVRILRAHIQEELAKAPWFFMRAAQNAMQFKTPLRIFGNIVSTGRSTEKTGCLDLKATMMPIVCFARLHALRKNLVCTPTTERLTAICDRGMLLPSRCHNILTAFETLLRMRLRHQSEMVRQGNAPDNLVNPAWLGHIDEAVLKECFREIDRI